MDHAKLSQERLRCSKMEPYDLITVVSQRAINSQLKAMYDKNESLRKIDLKNMHGDDTYTGLEAELYPPTVQLQLNTENRVVLYFLNIKTATLRYLAPDMATMSFAKKTCQFEDARIAVSVNLTLETKNFESLQPEIKEQLMKLGDYSINQLLIDFSSASLAKVDKLHSTYQAKLARLDAVPSGQFDVFINGYFNDLAKPENRHASVLHYMPLAKTDTDRSKYAMPTLPPTALTFQNVPFLSSQGDKGSAPNDDNMLVYLQVTNKGGHLPDRLLENSANWVVPSPPGKEYERYDGTVALSRQIFLDGWLLPKLAEFNRKSTWVAEEAWVENNRLTPSLHMNGHMKWHDAKYDDIKWNEVPMDSVDQWAKDRLESPSNLGGHWYTYFKQDIKDDNGVIQRAWQKTWTRNYCFIPIGYNGYGVCAIMLVGRTEVEFYEHSDLIASTVKVTGKWHTHLLLDRARDGKLRIEAIKNEPKIDIHADYAPLHDGHLDHMVNDIVAGLKELNMDDLVDTITTVLHNGWDFILPGAADFHIDRAVFNDRRDLLCELKYRA